MAALVVTPNIQHIALLDRDATFAEVYDGTPYQYADGWPVVRAAARLGNRPVSRVTGYELLPAVLARAAEHGVRTAFVGGRAGTDLGRDRILGDYPGLPIVMMEAEQYDAADTTALVGRLRGSDAALVVLGLGPPKQELIGAQLVAARCGVVLCVGTALEVAAGTSQRAPVVLQRLRVEWLYRIVREPRRLLRRYLTTFPQFLSIVRRQRKAQRSSQ